VNDGAIVVDASFAHTSNAENEWWKVNLGTFRSIAEVRLWLRSDAVYATRDSDQRLTHLFSNARGSRCFSAGAPPEAPQLSAQMHR
jgi:hypothetical protein